MNSTRALTVLELMSGRGLDNSIDGPLILSNQVDPHPPPPSRDVLAMITSGMVVVFIFLIQNFSKDFVCLCSI